MVSSDTHTKATAMTAQQTKTITAINAQHEAQRDLAQLNSRPVLSPKAHALNLYAAMRVAKLNGDLDTARALGLQLRPMLGELD